MILLREYSLLLLIVVVRLLKEKVRGQLLVLVTCEVGLDDLIARKSQSCESLNRIALFFRDLDSSGAWRELAALATFTLCVL